MKQLRMALEDLVLQAGLVVISSLLLVVILLFTLATAWAEFSSDHQQPMPMSWWLSADVGTTILIVRVLQGLLTATATAAISNAFTRLHWRGMHASGGLRLIDLVALSPTTLFSGTVRVILSPNSEKAARIWAAFRLCLTALPWLGGLLLFARTSLITVFDTATVYDVTAGIGPFNGSYVLPFLAKWHDVDNVTTVPYSYSSVVHNLITNTLFSTVGDPIQCQRSNRDLECASYILSGGLSMAAPWTPSGMPDYPLVRIPKVPAIQLEFQGRSGLKSFATDDCTLFGSNDTLIAAEFCLFLCNGISDNTCITPSTGPQPNLTTTFSIHTLTTTLLTSRSNLTILSLSSTSPPTPFSFNASSLSAYRSSLAWLLDYPRSGIPAPSSILEIFWSNQASLSDPFIDGVILQSFRSLLAFPIWLFNANNYGNTQIKGQVLNSNLPAEFYTKAGVVKPLVKLKFDKWLVAGFVALEGVVLVVLWGALVWLFVPWGSRAVKHGASTAFPVVDWLFGAEADASEVVGSDEIGLAGSKEVVERFGGVRVHAASGSDKGLARQRKAIPAPVSEW
ncbi:hypothetical protein B0T14DRAFT_568017 [Immersiella caudata]|uniref:Uncharacterized protein n=1 Tax=Immersiella caudata TaxID=314043 RepID=A0AA39WJ97_9PEZI|nr:hypothetical protein B0T14DRAFT_568017 [Immersiella caudata]